QRNRVNAGILIAPVGLETATIGVDSLVQQGSGLVCIAGLTRSLPAVLIHAPEYAEGLARRAVRSNEIGQHLLRRITAANAVQRQAQLLLHQNSGTQGLGHIGDEVDHALPVLDRTMGEQKVDNNTGLNGIQGTERTAERGDGLPSLLPRRG